MVCRADQKRRRDTVKRTNWKWFSFDRVSDRKENRKEGKKRKVGF